MYLSMALVFLSKRIFTLFIDKLEFRKKLLSGVVEMKALALRVGIDIPVVHKHEQLAGATRRALLCPRRIALHRIAPRASSSTINRRRLKQALHTEEEGKKAIFFLLENFYDWSTLPLPFDRWTPPPPPLTWLLGE